MAEPTYSVSVEMAVGSFTEVGSDCVKFAFTRERADIFSGLSAGRAQIVLDNIDGRYSLRQPHLSQIDSAAWAFYVSSAYASDDYFATNPYYGALEIGDYISIKATHQNTTYDLFYGRLKAVAEDPELSIREIVFDCYDLVSDLKRRRSGTPMLLNYRASSVFAVVTSMAGLTADRVDISVIPDLLPFYWAPEAPAIELLQELLKVGHYFMHVNGAGILRIVGRHFGLGNANVGSFSNDFLSFNWVISDRKVLNNIRIIGNPRQLATDVQTVAYLSVHPYIAPSSHYNFQLGYINPDNPSETDFPCASLYTPVASADYTANTLEGGTGLVQTSQVSVAATLFSTYGVFSCYNAGSYGVYLTKFTVRGSAVSQIPPVAVQVRSDDSISIFEQRDFSIESDYISDIEYAAEYAKYLLERRSAPLPEIQFSTKNRFPEILLADVGDAITLVESHTGVGSTYTISGLSHEVTFERGAEHVAEYIVERPTYGDFLILDTTPEGLLDGTRRLAPF